MIQTLIERNFSSDEEKAAQAVRVYGKLALTKYQQKYGGVAQLGEHLPCKQGVRSSILLISTSVSQSETRSYTGKKATTAVCLQIASRSRFCEAKSEVCADQWSESFNIQIVP